MGKMGNSFEQKMWKPGKAGGGGGLESNRKKLDSDCNGSSQ